MQIFNTIAKKFSGKKYGDKPYLYHIIKVIDKTLWLSGQNIKYPYDSYTDTLFCDWCVSLSYFNKHKEYFQLLLVAACHDALEDTNLTVQQLLAQTNQDVVDAVIAISKNHAENYDDYILACKNNKLAHTVKIADTLSNLEHSILSGNKARIERYIKQLTLLQNSYDSI